MKNPIKLIKSLNWTKDDLKKFILYLFLILIASIVFRIAFPKQIKVFGFLDTDTFVKGTVGADVSGYLSADVSGNLNTETEIKDTININTGLGSSVKITN